MPFGLLLLNVVVVLGMLLELCPGLPRIVLVSESGG